MTNQEILSRFHGKERDAVSEILNKVSNSSVGNINDDVLKFIKYKDEYNESIDSSHIESLSKAVSKIESKGYWDKVAFFAPAIGNNLSAALMTVKNPNGQKMEATNMSDSDYVKRNGFVVKGANTDKFISTGFVPSDNSLTAEDIGFGAFIPEYTSRNPLSSGSLISDNPASGDVRLFVLSSKSTGTGAIGIGTDSANLPSGKGLYMYNNNGDRQIYINGVAIRSESSVSNTAPVDTEITFFKSTRNGNVYYQDGSIGGFILTSGLTQDEAEHLSTTLIEFYIEIGRISSSYRTVFFGDSISSGQGSTDILSKFSSLVSVGIGSEEINYSCPSSELRRDINLAVSGYTKYPDAIKLPVNNFVIVYGTNDMNNNDGDANGNATAIADYKSKLTEIVQAVKSQGVRVVLCSAPYNQTSNATKRGAYGTAVSEVATSENVVFVDLNTLMSDEVDPTALMADANHPNNDGHKFIADAIINAIK